MLPDRVSNPGSLTYESGALPIALRGPALRERGSLMFHVHPMHEVLPGERKVTGILH